jgi:sialate O-acetylesterase
MKKNIGFKLLLVCSLLPLASTASADVRLPSIVSDNMLLQQQMESPVWGWANPGE